jgi:hypothetical protein
VCACSPGARECKRLQSLLSCRDEAGRDRRHLDGIGAIRLEAPPVTLATACIANAPDCTINLASLPDWSTVIGIATIRRAPTGGNPERPFRSGGFEEAKSAEQLPQSRRTYTSMLLRLSSPGSDESSQRRV